MRITEETNHPGASEECLKSTHRAESLSKPLNRDAYPGLKVVLVMIGLLAGNLFLTVLRV